jgi:hypothetical protein
MPTINDHKTNECNEAITITCDERNPNNGNASHHYQMTIEPGDGKPSFVVSIGFQDGPIKEVGVNGVTNEALLAILIDRMRGFQAGQYASRDNAVALTKMEEALMWLHKRTRDRLTRGVEGTHAK